MIAFLLIPQPAASARDWMVWGAAVCTALGVIVVTIRAVFKATARWVERKLVKALATEFTAVNGKIDTLTTLHGETTARNDRQHADVTAEIVLLREDFNAHMAEATKAGEVLAALVTAADLHVTSLRRELTDPGLPSGPPPGPKFQI